MKKALILTLTLCFFTGMTFSQEEKKEKHKFERGEGSFEYTAYAPLKDKPVTLFYYIPKRGNIKKMPVLFSMHGAERNGSLQRGVWRNLAEEYGFIVLAPQFVHKNGYLENDYQFGGVSEDPKVFKMRPRETWTYQIIESIFDYFKESSGNTSKTYHMFGHSAGGQFVHRYLLATPEARVGTAVAANPGNYTYVVEEGLFTESGVPADPEGWPFSIKGTPFVSDEYLKAYFKRNLIIQIGEKDDEPQVNSNTPENNAGRIQGITRKERAWKYFNISRDIALKKGFEFNWIIVEVPGAGHNSGQMVYGQQSVRNWRLRSGERVYNNKDLNNHGAFSLIFER